MDVTEEQIRETGEVVGLLVKTLKTLRLYQEDNVMSVRLEGELAARLVVHLERWGECELVVRERALVVGDEVVLTGGEGLESLPFLLFRDGIRRLSLLPGLTRDELHDLLLILNRAGVVVAADEDLVTMLWERDFEHVRYRAIDELSEESQGPVFSEQLAQGFSGEAEGSGGGGGPRVTLDDLRTPVSHLPVESCQLSEEETETLQAELAADERLDPARLTAELAAELVLKEDEEAERADLAGSVAGAFISFAAGGAAAGVLAAALRLDELATAPGVSPRLAELAGNVRGALAEPAAVEGLLDSLSATEPPSEGLLGRYLELLGAAALPEVVAWLGRLPTPGLRRELAEVVAAGGSQAVRALARQLERVPAEPSSLREYLDVARSLADAGGLDLIARYLEHPLPEIRQLAARSLPPVDRGRAQQLWVEMLAHSDPALRSMAVNALVSAARPELAGPLQEVVGRPEFAELPASEKRRLLAAVARLGGDAVLGWFEELMSAPRRSFFVPRAERETIEAGAAALRQVGTAAAGELLRELAARGDRTVRDACRRVLAAAGGERRG